MAALDHLLSAIARRHLAAQAARAGSHGWWWCAGAATVAVAAVRLSGWDDLAWSPAALAIPALLAGGWAVLRVRRPPTPACARLADRANGGDDLLLTAVQCRAGEGDWLALVRSRAETAAARLAPAQVVPWRPWPRAGLVAASAGLLVAAWFLMPVRDPFGWRQQQVRQRQEQTLLAEQHAAARAETRRLAELKPDAPVSPATEAALERLLAAFSRLDPVPGANARTLAERQAEIGKAFAAAKAAQIDPQELGQQVGLGEEAQRLAAELAKGDTRALAEQLDAAKDLAERLAAASDPGERRQLAADLRKKLEDLAAATQGKEAAGSLRQALDQLARASDPALRNQALDALAEQLQAAGLQMQALAQDARDAQALREMLQALQQARQLDGQPGCPKGEGCRTLEDYRKLYEAAMARCQGGAGSQPGQGKGPGIGNGRPAEYRDEAETGFNPERSPTALTAGRTLMQWSVKGPSDKGTAQEDYRRAQGTVRQAVAEALQREQLPPGQEEAVKRYFAE
jgi:hypothetical protein